MIHQHPYIRYAQALLIVENQLKSIDDITMEHIKAEIKKGLDAFCVEPAESYEMKKTVKFRFINDKNQAMNLESTKNIELTCGQPFKSSGP